MTALPGAKPAGSQRHLTLPEGSRTHPRLHPPTVGVSGHVLVDRKCTKPVWGFLFHHVVEYS